VRKISIIEHISLDGVIQAPAARAKRTTPKADGRRRHDDPVTREAIVAAHGKAFDLLLGRRTYDIFSGSGRKP